MSKEKLIPEFRFPEFKGEWSLEELGQCLDYLQPTPFLVDNTDYNDEYEIPVLTAGKSFILGYTNEQEGIFNENLPVIIFDDFTTASQFVDFPFKTKSSAMKILLAKNGNDIKFVYESMQTLNYEVGVHKRHWISVFSKLRIAVPKPQEQQKIASCLSSLDEVISAHSQKLDLLKDHKKGLLQNLFPQEGETVPKVRFPEFEGDGEWVEKELSEVSTIITGSTPSTKVPEYYGGDIMFVSPADISNNKYVESTEKTLSLEGFEKTRKIKANSVMFVCIGSTIGKVAMNKFECATNQQINSLVPNNENSSDFLYSNLELNAFKISGIAGNQAVPIINKTLFSSVKLKFPPTKEEQQKIASCLSAVDELITAQQEKIEQLQQHKKGLMQGLFPKIND
jgi:type I restriction enzyme S subunit